MKHGGEETKGGRSIAKVDIGHTTLGDGEGSKVPASGRPVVGRLAHVGCLLGRASCCYPRLRASKATGGEERGRRRHTNEVELDGNGTSCT
jgi:hypothetical protein